MDFQEIKNLVQGEGEKIIVVEEGKPVFVVLSYQDFQKIKTRNNTSSPKKTSAEPSPEFSQELTIDDLPLT